MASDYDRRVAVLESLRAGRTPKEIIKWFGYNKTQVYDLAKRYRETKDKEALNSKRKCHNQRSDCKRNEDFLAKLRSFRTWS